MGRTVQSRRQCRIKSTLSSIWSKNQAELIRSVKVVGEIKTTAKMAMEVVVEKQAANYDHINAANDKLNNVIKGFSTLGDKTKFFTREMWGPGGEEYFQKFLR